VRWYYKAGLIVGLIWATARVLGAYGEASRELDLAFLFGFMLTIGGWSAAFLVVDWVGRAVGLIKPRAEVDGDERGRNPAPVTRSTPNATAATSSPGAPTSARRGGRSPSRSRPRSRR